MRSKRRLWMLAVITIAGSLLLALAAAEWLLRWQRERIESSERMEPGMVLYDQRMGWRLQPGWHGQHHHHDYAVKYSIGNHGYRNTPGSAVQFISSFSAGDNLNERGRKTQSAEFFGIRGAGNSSGAKPQVALVGDSFTFGLGVKDAQTFAALLNRRALSADFHNMGIPGYSTDQELLLIRERLFSHSPEQVILLVYLGNDLLDIERAYPLQAEYAKPYFELDPEGLRLSNVPVPRDPKPTAESGRSLASEVLGQQTVQLPSWMGRLELLRRLDLLLTSGLPDNVDLDRRFSGALELFGELVREAQRAVAQWDGRLSLVLLPGRSYVEDPDSISADVQEYLRRRIISLPALDGLTIIDLSPFLRRAASHERVPLFFPYDGHLTPHGHQMVADALADKFSI